MARIILVYTERPHRLINMSYIRWYRMAEALSRLGHHVDIAVGEQQAEDNLPPLPAHNVKKVAINKVKWNEYDVVKVSYIEGWTKLKKYGGRDHPFLIVRLGTVVAKQDLPGIYFLGRERKRRFTAQTEMCDKARYISVLNASARNLLAESTGRRHDILIVPGSTDSDVPPPGIDPFPPDDSPRCLFAGNLLSRRFAGQANALVSRKLNRLGAALGRRGVKLYVLGSGDASRLDPAHVCYLGAVDYHEAWNYMHHADVGVELVRSGTGMLNTESSKLYHYLRVGLPVVSEEGLPNVSLVREARCGFVVQCDDMDTMAQRIWECANSRWNTTEAAEFIARNHTWNDRARIYQPFLESD